MTRVHGYYWVKFAHDPQPQIVMIHVDGTVWVFGEPHGQYIAGEGTAALERSRIIARDPIRTAYPAGNSSTRSRGLSTFGAN
jgi:hypothetical protein